MKLQFVCPHWGQEDLPPERLLFKIRQAGYTGLEINTGDLQDARSWLRALESWRRDHPDFLLIVQMVPQDLYGTAKALQTAQRKAFRRLLDFQPDCINAHTGKDFFSFDENCRLIEAAEDFSQQNGCPVYHETHRGRFSFAAHLMPAYLQRFDRLRLVADYSHWCNVSESMLEFQTALLKKLRPYIAHIHARVGWPQGPQLADPFTPGNASFLKCFTGWWADIIDWHQRKGRQELTLCTEAGPWPYMPADRNGKSLARQWSVNTQMLNYLKNRFASPESTLKKHS